MDNNNHKCSILQKQLVGQADILIGSIWQHYKGGFYVVEGFAMRESSHTIDVLYKSNTNPLPYPWSRPITEWHEIIASGDKPMKRFVMLETPWVCI